MDNPDGVNPWVASATLDYVDTCRLFLDSLCAQFMVKITTDVLSKASQKANERISLVVARRML